MELTHPNIAIQARTSHLQRRESPFKTVVQNEPKILAEIFLCIPLIAAGVIFHLSAVQWILLSAVTLFFLLACIFRTAAMLQAKKDKSLSSFHVNRIKCMGNALVTITAGISVITCLLIFVPLINQVI